MGKQALCISKDDISLDHKSVGLVEIPDDFYKLEAHLVERDICETDTSLLQLIPYIVVYNMAGGIFCYRRGGGGGEGRLLGKRSIGIGGHVEREPSGGLVYPLSSVLLHAAERELKEELGMDGGPSHFTSLIYTAGTGNQVDQVHLGLLSHVTVYSAESFEPDIVTDGKFMTLPELMQPQVFEELEVWSQVVVRRMWEQLSESFGKAISSFGSLAHRLAITSNTGATSFAAQELGVMLSAIGHNIEQGYATAELHDVDEAIEHLRGAAGYLKDVERMLGRTIP